jgi:hypothetical protein
VHLDNKDKYSIFKDMLYNLCFISHKVLFNTEILSPFVQKYWLFCEACNKNEIPPQKVSSGEPKFGHLIWSFKGRTLCPPWIQIHRAYNEFLCLYFTKSTVPEKKMHCHIQ